MPARKLFLAAFSVLALPGIVLPQMPQPDKTLVQRLSDELRKQSVATFFTATRYVPATRFRGIGTWSSPQNSILIDEIPFDGFPLNLQSPDFVPIDLLSIDSVVVNEHPLLSPAGRMSGGAITLVRAPIPDSLLISGRFFAGSETGDPVLQKYTRDNLELFNKNKIGISGAASLANRSGNIRYRVVGGVFGYFSTGYAGRDAVILSYIDRRMYSRQNRNYLGTVELEYSGENGRNVSLYAGINGLVGWEQMPFLPTFAFFEGSMNTLRARLTEFLQHLDLTVRRDETFVAMRKQYGTEAGEYSAANYSFHPVWRGEVFGGISLMVYGELALHTAVVPRKNSLQQFFAGNVRKTSWALGTGIDHEIGDLRLLGHVRLDRSLAGTNDVSVYASASLPLSTHARLQATAGSAVLTPDLLELYGQFSTTRERPALARVDTFWIKGNPELGTGRVHSVDFAGTWRSGLTSCSVTAFYQILERPIDRLIESMARTSFPGDVVFSGHYVNSQRRSLLGLENSLLVNFTGRLDLQAMYIVVHRDEIPSVPMHQLRVRVTASLASSTLLDISMHGQTKTHWQEFVVQPWDDDKAGEGIDGSTPEFWSLDVSLSHRLGTIWFGREVKARLELQNIFHRHVQYLPIGISYDTAVIGYLSFML